LKLRKKIFNQFWKEWILQGKCNKLLRHNPKLLKLLLAKRVGILGITMDMIINFNLSMEKIM
jgi:hypothetical protein